MLECPGMAKLRNISRSDVEAWPQQTSLRRLRCFLKSALNTLGALRDGGEAQRKLVNLILLSPRDYLKVRASQGFDNQADRR